VVIPMALARTAGAPGADSMHGSTYRYVNTGGAWVRRADSNTATDRYRLWEIPGAPHVPGGGGSCSDGSSSFPTPAFFRAAAAALVRWSEHGVAPAPAPRIDLATLADVSVSKTDQYGNAVGGIRSPFVDEPLASYRVHSGPGPTCKLLGIEQPLSSATLRSKYGNVSTYMSAFTKSLDKTIKAGHLLTLDRWAIIAAQLAKARVAFSAG